MALVSEDSLRDLFGHVVVGKTYSHRSKPYTVVSKLIYSAVFDGEREYWIEIEFQGPDGLCFLEFDYGSWTLSHHIGGFESGTSYEHDVLNRLKEGSPFRLLDSNYSVLEAAEAEVVFVQGAPSDQTTVGEHFRYVDLSTPGINHPLQALEWDPKDPSSIEAFHVEALPASDALLWLQIFTSSPKHQFIQSIIADEDDDDEGSSDRVVQILVVAFVGVYFLLSMDGNESREDCLQRVQTELQAQGIPAGDTIRQADMQCTSTQRSRRSSHRRSFGK